VNNNNSGHSGQARKRKASARRRSVPPAPVTVTVHDPRALKVAQSIVLGYANRGYATHVVGNPDGSMLVVNGR
jgi:hypothetical protein